MDLSIVQWVADHLHTPFFDWLMPIITSLGDNGIFWIFLTFVLLAFQKTRRMGIVCAFAMLFTFVGGELILKNIIQRGRPFTVWEEAKLLIAAPGSFSFPSGHSGSSFAAAVSIFLCNRKWGIPALILAALIAFSRVYLSVHYTTDVLAGMILGTGCALLAKWVYDRYRSR